MPTLPPEDHDKKLLRRALGMIDRPVTTMILEAVDPVLPTASLEHRRADEPALTLETGADTDPDDAFLSGYDLTSLEREIVVRWRDGRKAREIAEIVYRSESTISNTVTRLRTKHGTDLLPRRRSGSVPPKKTR